jgi:DNA-directed RNA polymerase subunit beta'
LIGRAFQGKQDLKPQLVITDKDGNPVKSKGSSKSSSYDLSVGIILNIEKGKEVKAGDVIARIPRASSKTKDITGGLPRVADIFESRKPKNPAVLAEISGTIEFGKDIKSKRRIIINPEEGEPIEYLIPKGTYIYFNEGDKVNKGDMIVDGTPSPNDILNILGIEALAEYMVKEVKKCTDFKECLLMISTSSALQNKCFKRLKLLKLVIVIILLEMFMIDLQF